jgi:hypothetical protein
MNLDDINYFISINILQVQFNSNITTGLDRGIEALWIDEGRHTD